MAAIGEGRIGFLGGGAMGEALAGGLLAASVSAARVAVAELEAARREHLSRSLGVRVTSSNAELVSGSDVVVLAVKPGVVAPALAELRKGDAARDLARPLWISIAAGLPLAKIEAELPARARVVRAIPNTPALVRAGATALVANAHATADDRAQARELFASLGCVWEAPEERLLDAVTGLSGSGPAYVFVFLEALSDAGVRVGLPRDAAATLAVHTVLGAAKLALESGVHPAQLKDRVTSPGGTTIAGLARLEARGFRAAVLEAVEAATRRASELAR